MISYLVAFYLYVCEPSHDFFDESVANLRCSDDDCCSDKADLMEIFPTDESENDVDQDKVPVEDW